MALFGVPIHRAQARTPPALRMQRRRSRAPREPAHHDRACQHGTLFTS